MISDDRYELQTEHIQNLIQRILFMNLKTIKKQNNFQGKLD